MKHSSIAALALGSLFATLAGCGTDSTSPVESYPLIVDLPPTPRTPPAFPSPSRPSALYNRVSPASLPGNSRYVVYDDNTFSLQYASPDHGFLEYPGRYSREASAITFIFDASPGNWRAAATISGDSLIVTYNLIMQMSDFEDGVFSR